MWKCTKTAILEDKFGVDHQFLKGHNYPNIVVDPKSNNIIDDIIMKNCQYLTKEQRDEYFAYIETPYLRVTEGLAKTIGWSRTKKDIN
jgi:hypothetical protein